MTRVAVVDDHHVVRQGLEAVLERVPDIEVVGSFSRGQDLIDALPSLRPDLVLMDMRLPDGLGSSWVTQAKRLHPGMKVLILTGYHSDAKLLLALEADADGFMYKESSAEELLRAVREVAEGNFYVSPEAARRMRDLKVLSGGSAVTAREVEVLLALRDGMTTEEIARALLLSVSTVKTHLGSVYRKLESRNRVEAVREAIKRGIISDE